MPEDRRSIDPIDLQLPSETSDYVKQNFYIGAIIISNYRVHRNT